MNSRTLKTEWLGNVRGDVIAGVVVAFALIPEAIAFSIIAGVDPKVGLYASFCIAVVTAIFGGRAGMISAATGATALVMGPLVRQHGLHYLLAASMLAGAIQIGFGLLKLGRYMKYVPRSVMVGYVNALAVLLFTAQLPQFIGQSWPMYALVAGGLAIIYLTPKAIAQRVPPALIALVVITAISVFTAAPVRHVGDMGALPSSLPAFGLALVPLTLETLRIIAPYSVTLAMIGLLASLLCASMLDELTATSSDKNREACAQGAANITSSMFGGMAGCAMIGQSVFNFKLGGRGRLSSLVAGAFLLFLIVVMNRIVAQIPMAIIVAIMFMVAIGTMDWRSFRRLPAMPRPEAIAMVATVGTILATRNFALGVGVGVVLSSLFFARSVSKAVRVERDLATDADIYRVSGDLFFASVQDLVAGLSTHSDRSSKEVAIDLSDARIWDGAAVSALDNAIERLHERGARVRLTGVCEHSARLVEQVGGKSRGVLQEQCTAAE